MMFVCPKLNNPIFRCFSGVESSSSLTEYYVLVPSWDALGARDRATARPPPSPMRAARLPPSPEKLARLDEALKDLGLKELGLE
jgi:hypothetical protein